MGPSCAKSPRRKSSSRKGKRRTRTRTLFKKQMQSTNSNPDSSSASNADSNMDMSHHDFTECSTPKAERFRIPEIKTCPPAPKKTRSIKICSLRRAPAVTFFTPPDIDLFFHFALRGIPA